jgi:hypothetical protein
MLSETHQGLSGTPLGEFWSQSLSKKEEIDGLNVPCRNRGKKAIKKTRKMEIMQRRIHSKTGTRL